MKRAWIIKLFHYEYWPMWAFYIPLFPYFLIKGIINRHLFYFTNANPSIDEFGGLFFDSKNDIDRQIPEKHRPVSIPVSPCKNSEEAIVLLKKLNLNYPVIAKPDCGERGEGVVKIDGENELTRLLCEINKTYLIQEYIAYPKEYGVFIAFIPETKKYKVISIAEKVFFNVDGNGNSTIKELILLTERGVVFFENLKNRSAYPMDYIPKMGENCIIHSLGNHCNGTQFINRNNLKSIQMDDSFNLLMQSLEGINYGRFDIKTKNFEDLITFENCKIIEFNGVAAEPIHIYDSEVGYFKSLKSFITHWAFLHHISIYNKKLGFKPANHIAVMNKIGAKFF